MTKEQLFKKYSINESHSKWDNQIDNWISVEIFRLMHEGRLPNEKDIGSKYVINFLDKLMKKKDYAFELITQREDFGSLYLTAKRMIYRFSDNILKD